MTRTGKIFGIGLSRTGTSSLTKALKLIGFSAVHFPMSDAEIRRHDAATDISVAIKFREFDRQYPNSKFILTTRNKADWLASCRKFWQLSGETFADYEILSKTHELIYGTKKYDAKKFSLAYDKHMDHVLRHFNGRDNELLILNIFNNKNPWCSLCKFLDVPIPSRPYPHQNSSEEIDRLIVRLLDVLGNLELTAELSKVPIQYVCDLREELSASEAQGPISLSGEAAVDIIRSVVQRQGIETARRILDR